MAEIYLDPMKSHVRGVILEGLSNAGKTSTLKALKQAQANHENSERSLLVLGEHYSQQLQTINGESVSLTRDEHINLLNDRIEGIEKLNDWATYLGPASRRSRGLFFVLERFHLNHRFSYGNSAHIASVEDRIFELNGVCFLLIVSPNYIRERILYREKYKLNRLNIDHVCDDWLEAQERLITLSRESHVPTTIIETDGREWDTYASHIIDAMGK